MLLGDFTTRSVQESKGDDEMEWQYLHCDHGVLDWLSEIALGHVPHLTEDHGGDLLRAERSILTLDID